MNKNDIKLIIFLLVIMLVFFLFKINNNSKEKIAYVYYEDELIKTISLEEDGIYSVLGYNGEVLIEIKDKKIRVLEETSAKNLCSKQGYGEVIVCLPNKIVIKVVNNELDGVVK